MQKYTPSFVDVSGFSKAYTDEIFRNAQLNIRREQALDSNINQFQRMYAGKVRPVDLVRFNEKFDEFAVNSKEYMRANRSGTSRGSLSAYSMMNAASGKGLKEYVQTSAQLGQTFNALKSLPKDKILDTPLYNSVMMDLSSMESEELANKYGGLDKIPTSFEYKPKSFKIETLNRGVQSVLKQSVVNPLKWTPATDENGNVKRNNVSFIVKDAKGKDITVSESVPLKRLNVDLNPLQIRNAVSLTQESNYDIKDFLKKNSQTIKINASNPNDPQQAQIAAQIFDYALKNFGKSKVEDLDDVDIYSAQYAINSNLGPIEIEDFDALEEGYKVLGNQQGVTIGQERLKNLREQGKSIQSSKELSTFNQIMSVINKTADMGFWDLDAGGLGDEIINLFERSLPAVKGKIDKNSLKQAAENKRQLYNQRNGLNQGF